MTVGVRVWLWGCMHLFELLFQLFRGYFSILQRKEGWARGLRLTLMGPLLVRLSPNPCGGGLTHQLGLGGGGILGALPGYSHRPMHVYAR